jgi:LPS-assembly protein
MGFALPGCKGCGKLTAVHRRPDARVRPALRLLPLPLCIAMSLAAHAADDKPNDWGLCPINDAVPAFDVPLPESGAGDQRADAPTEIEGDRAEGVDGEVMHVQGSVALKRGDQYLGADTLRFDSQTDHYVAEGNIRYQDAGMRLVAERAEGDQDTDRHQIDDVRYQLTRRRGNGVSERITLHGAQGSLYGSTYSSCDPDDRLWELRARQIDINTEEGMGVARNAILRVGRVPVLYVPWLMFPIDERRRTGLLYPTVSLSGRNGFDFKQPIYLNLAPNYDATLTPRLMSERGVLLGGEFRYLYPNGRGTAEAAFMPDDRLAERERDDEIAAGIPPENRRGSDRGLFRFNGFHNLDARWQARGNLTWISDPRVIEDFSNSLNGTSIYTVQSNLGVYGRGRTWEAGAMADHWQLADATLSDANLPYSRLPRVYARWEQPFGRWFAAGLDAEAVQFQHAQFAAGSRLDLKPFIGMPLQGASWFLRPNLAWRYTGYQLDDALAASLGGDRAPSRSLPITTVDAGLFFDRQTDLGGERYLHTLEPRLYYLRAPFRDQDSLPLFDTQPLTFSYGQLFRDNRYSGPDRQIDANQLTLALGSRLIREADGREKLTASFGQIHYFDDSRVTVPGETPVAHGKSAWVADAMYAPGDRWTINATYQWDPKFRREDLASVRARYLIGDEGVANLGYRYRRDLLEQTDLSFLFPVSPSWSLVGRYYYSLLDHRTLETIAGVQWDSCCLAVRAVARRYVRNRTGELNNALQFEIELKGLGAAGPDTERVLRRAILGYNRDDLYLVPPPEVRDGGQDSDPDPTQ